MLSVRFPGMILQPIVENAIHYAFPEDEDEASSVEQEKRLRLRLYQKEMNASFLFVIMV